MSSPAGSQSSSSGGPGPEASGQDLLVELERRVLLLIEELRAARQARRQAEAESEDLREQVRARDAEVARLGEQLEVERGRIGAAKERVAALIERIDDLETGT